MATPTRLKYFRDNSYVTYELLKYFVLDEADLLLDLEFVETIKKIMSVRSMRQKKRKYQTLVFSAARPKDIQWLINGYLHGYIYLTIGLNVAHNIYQTAKLSKRDKLTEILNKEFALSQTRNTMVYVDKKETAAFLAPFLSETYPTVSVKNGQPPVQRGHGFEQRKIIVTNAIVPDQGTKYNDCL